MSRPKETRLRRCRLQPQEATAIVGLIVASLLLPDLECNSTPSSREPKAMRLPPRRSTLGMSCGPAALIAMTNVKDAGAAARLSALMRSEGLASRPVTSFHDLIGWAKRIDLRLTCREIRPADLELLPLPAIAHTRSHHFSLITAVCADHVTIVEQGVIALDLPRHDFERDFSGFVLCAPLN